MNRLYRHFCPVVLAGLTFVPSSGISQDLLEEESIFDAVEAADSYDNPADDVSGYDYVPETLPPAADPPVETETSYSQADYEIPSSDFLGAPPMPGNIRDLSSGEAPDSYFVEKGDTLFDICDQLLDEAGYWPKLWSFNPQIKNPHFIWPGMRLVFFAGSDETPPFLEVEGDAELLPIDTGKISSELLVDAELPQLSDGLLSINPTEIIGPDQVPAFPEGLILVDYTTTAQSRTVTMPGFVFDDEMESLAETIGVTDEGAPGSKLRKVIIELEEEDSIEAGQSYTILREAEELENLITGEDIGYRYEYVTQIRIEEVMEEEGAAYGYTFEPRLVPSVGDVIVPYQSALRSAPASVDPKKGQDADTVVVGLSHDRFQLAMSDQHIFLDATNESFSQGQVINIYQSWARFGGITAEDYIYQASRIVAQAYIIDVGDLVAVGKLFNVVSPVSLGDAGNQDAFRED